MYECIYIYLCVFVCVFVCVSVSECVRERVCVCVTNRFTPDMRQSSPILL